MTAPGQVASHAKHEAADVAGTATDKAAEVKNVAADQVGQVKDTALGQASDVLGETVGQAKDLAAQVKEQATAQLETQSERVSGAMRELSGQLSSGDTSGVVGQLLTEAGQRLQSLTDYVDRVGTEGLVRDLRSYARRNPGTFLLGAALAGLVSGRVVKGIASKKDAVDPQSPETTPSLQPSLPAGTAAGSPLAGITEEGIGQAAGYSVSPYPGESYQVDPVTPAGLR